MKKVAIIVPIYNEQKYITDFLHDLLKLVRKEKQIFSVIIVNDGSTDDSLKLIENIAAKNSLITITNLKVNEGKGSAMKKGLRTAIRMKADAVIFMDGDGQHDPKYIPSFLRELAQYPIVLGYRNLAKDVPYLRKLGNNIARFIFRTFFNIRRKDLLCGFMGIRKDAFHLLSWHSTDYGVEAELSAIIGKYNTPFKELFISTIYYDKYKGVTILDAFFILLKIPYWYFRY